MEELMPLPRWLRAVFIIVMLAVVAELAWFAVAQYELRFQVSDVALSLDTSRQREAKQQYEYDQAAAELPLAKEELAATLPLAEAAKAQETELRAQRKQLRSDAEDLAAQLETALALQAELQTQADALRSDVEALAAQEAALQAQVDALLHKPGRTD